MANEKNYVIGIKDGLFNLSQYSKKKKGFTNELRRLIITVGLFLILQLIFIIIDGTFLEPNFNRIGNFANSLADAQFFKIWSFLYDNPIFRLVTPIAILHIIYVLIKTIIIGIREKDTELN